MSETSKIHNNVPFSSIPPSLNLPTEQHKYLPLWTEAGIGGHSYQTNNAPSVLEPLTEHPVNLYCRRGPSVRVSWRVSSTAHQLMQECGAACRQSNATVDFPVANGVIQNIQTNVFHHHSAPWLSVSSWLGLCALALCLAYPNLGF